MSPATLESLQDAIQILQKAKSSEKGIKVTFGSMAARSVMRHRIYSARSKLKQQSRRVYDLDHESYDRSEFDDLTVISEPSDQKLKEDGIEDSTCFLLIKHATKEDMGILEIEEL